MSLTKPLKHGGQWGNDEEGYYAEITHVENTIHAQGKVAEKIILRMKKI